jgi:hypothetical protein
MKNTAFIFAIIISIGGGLAAYHFLYVPATVIPVAPPAAVHTPAWYEAHQDVLTQDDHTCQSQGANVSSAMCENVAIAAQFVGAQNFQNALNNSSASGK